MGGRFAAKWPCEGAGFSVEHQINILIEASEAEAIEAQVTAINMNWADEGNGEGNHG